MLSSIAGQPRSYWFAGLMTAPNLMAATTGQCGSRMSSRARNTTSAFLALRMPSACSGSVMRPTAPTGRSG